MRVPGVKETRSPMLDPEKPSPENLLMAAATMHQLGLLVEPQGTPRPVKLAPEKSRVRSGK